MASEEEQLQAQAAQSAQAKQLGAPESDGVPVGALIKLALAAAVVAAMVIFVLQNLDNVPVNFLSWSFDAPLIVLLAAAAVAGILLRWILGFLRARRKRTAA